MPLAEASVQISRPAAQVFALLDYTARAPEWLESCLALAQRTPGPTAVGTPPLPSLSLPRFDGHLTPFDGRGAEVLHGQESPGI